MKNSPRIAPLFVAFSVVLSAAPQAALAQVVARAAVAPEAAVSAAASAVAPLSSLALPAALGAAAPLGTLSAPALAPALAPSAVPAAAAAPANGLSDDASRKIRTPGAAAAGVAAEAAAYAGKGAAAPAVRKGLIGRISDALLGRASFSALFDASTSRGEKPAPIFGRQGLRENKPILLPNNTRPDEQPTIPSPDRERTVHLQTYSLPGARDVGGVLEASRRILDVDPNDVTAVVAAVRGLVDADRTRYGVSSSELRLIGARKFDGRGEQADTIFVHFRQVKDNLVVNGANLSFTMKVVDGKPEIVAQTGKLFPQIDVNTESTLTEEQIMGKIAERVGLPVSEVSGAFQFSEEKIVYSRGTWRHVKLYVAPALPFMIAVDMANGLVFAWDNRTGLTQSPAPEKKKDAAVGGTIAGKAVDHGPILPTAQLADIPLGFLNLTIGGKTYTTDKDGKFSADGLDVPAEGLTLAATLSGPYASVEDSSGKTLTINVAIKPGDGAVSAVFNPDSTLNDENAIAQVSAFNKVNFAYNFLRERKLTTEQMDKNPIVVRTNLDQECNAYYTPGTPSLNFFKSSANCVNSAYDTVADHEYGHYWDDMTGGIMNGGLSEGWGDTVSMYSLNNPVIGEHFLKTPDANGKDYIRVGDARNTYKYNEFDEVHAQSQAFTRPIWMFRAFLIEKLGPAAGAALAEAIVLPTMFAKAASIPDALAQVLINAMKKDGSILYEKEFRALVAESGITLPASSGAGFVAGLVDRFTAPLRRVKVLDVVAPYRAIDVFPASKLAQFEGEAGAVRQTMRFTAGMLFRGRVSNEIRRYMDETGLKYELHEYKSMLSSDFLLVIEGPQDKVAEHVRNISNWIRSLERGR